MKKLTDADVRHHANGYPESSPSYRIATELITQRAEVRRLRKAMWDAWHDVDLLPVFAFKNKVRETLARHGGRKGKR